jgi:DNA phosphorothioation-dependent restriction protein DptH
MLVGKTSTEALESEVMGEALMSEPERVDIQDISFRAIDNVTELYPAQEDEFREELKVAESPEVQVDEGNNLNVLFGHNAVTQAPLNWEPTNTAKFMNTNTGIIGTMGTGKTQFTKSVVAQLYHNQIDNVGGAPIGMLIFDYKSDYVDDKFQYAAAGKKFNLHKLPYNPLSLFGDTPMLPVHTARSFSETMAKAFNLGQKQQLRLRKLVGEAYELAGIRKAEPTTWSKPAPTIADVWALFIDSEPDEDSLYAALESLYELEIFEDDNSKCQSLYELIDGVTVIELASYPGEIQSLVVALTLDLFYSQMQKKGKPDVQGDYRQITKMILVDEADNFMSQNFTSLRKILKEGREYGVGVILSTQDITHFHTGENDYSSYILSWVVHRVARLKPQDLKAIFSVNEKAEQDRLMETINKLDKHYSLYIDGAKKVVKMRDRAFWELITR